MWLHGHKHKKNTRKPGQERKGIVIPEGTALIIEQTAIYNDLVEATHSFSTQTQFVTIPAVTHACAHTKGLTSYVCMYVDVDVDVNADIDIDINR